MALKPDVREIYLKQFLSVQATKFYDFKELYDYAFLILGDNEEALDELYYAEYSFLKPLENEGKLPSLDYVLYLMDCLALSGKNQLLVKTKKGRVRVKFIDLVFNLSEFKSVIFSLVRHKASSIRIINPDVVF